MEEIREMKIAVVGTGYVGLTTGVALSSLGHKVICIDKDESKIEKLKRGDIPIYEPGLDDLLNAYKSNIKFTSKLSKAVRESQVIFICVGTPSREDGSIDMSYFKDAVGEIAKVIDSYKIIINKSTVPVGKGNWVREEISKYYKGEFSVVSNPEFLREGSALKDFLEPDKIVIGVEDEKVKEIMLDIYSNINAPKLITDIKTAEMIKYASNAFLAMKISYVNEPANLCEKVGADIQVVTSAMGRDGRISPKFLHCGPGYGGSCFPKDTKALAKIGRENNSPITLIESTIKANQNQKLKMVEKIEKAMKNVKGKTITILGLAFKPETEDIREAPSMFIIDELYQKGAKIKAFDPQAMEEARKKLKHLEGIIFCKDEYEAIKGADALVIITEWNQFRRLDFAEIKK